MSKERFMEVSSDWDNLDNIHINLSQEGYDTIMDGPRPNGSSKSWYIKETGKMSPPYTLGKWNFFDEIGNWFSNKRLKEQHHIHIIDPHHCHFKPVEQLKGEKHLYIITVYNPDFFEWNKNIGFSCMDEQYQKDVREGNCYVVVLYPYEGYPGTPGNRDFEWVELWRKKAAFPPGSVHFVTGNLAGPNNPVIKKSGVVAHPVCMFDSWNHMTIDEPIPNYEPVDDKNLFLSYNRNPRYSRVYLVCKMIEYGVLNRGLVSLQKPDWWKEGNNIQRGDGTTDESYHKLGRMLPLELEDNTFFNLACNINTEEHRRTFMSIVTETLVEEGTLFLSEKIWKPIQVGHPFMVLGSTGTLDYLRNHGFRTFGEWWDESYDQMMDYRLKAEAIMKQVRKISEYSVEDLKIIRGEMEEVIRHNKELHYKKQIEDWGLHQSRKPVFMLKLLQKLYYNLHNAPDNLL